MISVSIISSSPNKPIDFLNASATNYVSARVLYLSNQLHDAGFLAHEAVEKVLKAILYQHDPKLKLDSVHDLNALRNKIIHLLSIDIREFKEVFKYFEDCYSYRYPDKKKAKSFSTSTTTIHLLDAVYNYFHSMCSDNISDPIIKNKSGIFSLCRKFFESSVIKDVDKLIRANDEISIDSIIAVQQFWHNKNYFKELKGIVHYPEGSSSRKF